jgi:hypothetical protein
MSAECALPLCPSCIKTHILEHQQEGHPPQIETLGGCFKLALSALEDVAHAVQGTLAQHSQEMINKLLAQLAEARSQTLAQVGRRFDSLEAELREAVLQFTTSCSPRHDYAQLHSQLSASASALEALKE